MCFEVEYRLGSELGREAHRSGQLLQVPRQTDLQVERDGETTPDGTSNTRA